MRINCKHFFRTFCCGSHNVFCPYDIAMITLGHRSYIFGQAPTNFFDVDVLVGKYSGIGTHLTILGGKGQHPSVLHPECVSNFPFEEFKLGDYYPSKGKGQISIGHDVWIGANVTLLDGITIGDGSIIGAGAVVATSIPPYALAVGNPVEIKRYRFEPDVIAKLEAIAWWDWEEAMIQAALPQMKDIDAFIAAYG